MINLDNFECSRYPDGHIHVKSSMDLHGEREISAALRTGDDYFKLAQVKHIHPELVYLQVRYISSGRCDRRFSPGEDIDLVRSLEYLKSLGFINISFLDPHNPEFIELSNFGKCYNSLTNLVLKQALSEHHKGATLIVSSDENQARKTSKLLGTSDYRYNFSKYNRTFFVKKRKGDSIELTLVDNNDEISKYDSIVVLDDICDGGKTHIEIAKILKPKMKANAELILAVPHVIFSKGIDVVAEHYNHIYCTDSFKAFTHPKITQLSSILH